VTFEKIDCNIIYVDLGKWNIETERCTFIYKILHCSHGRGLAPKYKWHIG